MTDPIAAAREKLIELILHYDGSDAFACADAILAAFPQLAAPTQSAVEEARQLGKDIAEALGRNGADFLSETNADETIAEMVATAITAAEARVREECAKKCDALQEAALRRASEPGATQNYATHQQAVADSARECAAAIRCGGVRHLSAE